MAAVADATSPPAHREAPITRLAARAYTIPTDRPEADGTLSWDSTTLVVVDAEAGGLSGIGYTYADASIARLIEEKLAVPATSCDALDPPAAWRAMQRSVRNLGRAGLTAAAISAVDTALWDLKAKLLNLPLALLFGRFRNEIAVYGSGGFTSYTIDELRRQLAGWVEQEGCAWVKMKVGSDAATDPHRVAAAKAAIGTAGLFVDANGAYTAKQALELADRFATEANVCWFEEPVSSDDLDGLCEIRRRAPASMEIAAGEYAYDTDNVRHMLGAGAVDVQQADVTRCGGFTGFLQIAALCEAHHIDLSGHCAPSLHLHAACAAPRFRHLEWFHDHVRIEHMLFDGAPLARDCKIRPDLSRPGIGLDFKRQDAARFAVS
jgi:L-alanine-DL-glutamate epimerase-like enolase superfamily enzyme